MKSDLLGLDPSALERRIAAVKRRGAQPARLRLQPYVPEFSDTVPTAPARLAEHACRGMCERGRCAELDTCPRPEPAETRFSALGASRILAAVALMWAAGLAWWWDL